MRGPRFETYERNDGLVDWRLKAGNAEVVATSHGQGFRDRTDAERSIRSVAYAVLAMVENAEEGETDPFGLAIVHLEAGELGFTPSGEETEDDAGAQEHEENGETEAGDGHDVGWNTEADAVEIGGDDVGDVLGREGRGDRIDG